MRACVRACVVCSFLFSHRGSECCTKLMILLHDEGREFAFLHAVLGVCFAAETRRQRVNHVLLLFCFSDFLLRLFVPVHMYSLLFPKAESTFCERGCFFFFFF